MFQTISRIAAIIVATIVLSASIPASASEPTPFRAVYKARFKGFPIGATGERELTKVGDDQYLLTSTAHNFLGRIAEQTRFRVQGGEVVPQEYQYHRTGIGRNRSTVMTFDWASMQATTQLDSRSSELALMPGLQDKLSYQFKLRRDLTDLWQQGKDLPILTYKIDDDGEMKEYSFKIVGEEDVDTPLGKFKTVKATRADGNPDRTSNFWLAPAYDFMLVRFEQTEPDGKGFELLLREAVFDGKKIVGKK